MRVMHLAFKDLQQILRDRKMLFFTLVMPIAFTMFLGFMMGGQGTESDARPLVAWVDEDGSAASAGLAELLQAPGTLRLEAMAPQAAEDAVRTGQAAAMITAPRGLGQALAQGQAASVELVVAGSQGGNPVVDNALQSAVARLNTAAQAARLATAEVAAYRPFAGEAEAQASFQAGLSRANELWAAPALSVRPVAAAAKPANAFTQSSPGMLVQFTVFNLMGAAIVLVLERQSGALRRLLTTPISKAGILAGKVLAVFVVALVQGLILVAVGQLAFGVDYLASPLATLAVLVSFSACMAALGLLLGTLATSDGAVVAASLVLMFVLAGMGGAWFPLEATGPTFAAVGHLLPSAWAMDGFRSILLRGAGLSGVLVPVGILLAYGVTFFAVAAWRFRFE